MKSRLWILIVTVLLCSSCTTFTGGGLETVDAYRIGRVAAVAYLAVEDNADRKEAMRVAWLTFSDALDAIEGEKEVPAYLKTILRERITDDRQYMLACEAVDLLWSELTARVDLSAMNDVQVVAMLQLFRRGVADALLEYGP